MTPRHALVGLLVLVGGGAARPAGAEACRPGVQGMSVVLVHGYGDDRRAMLPMARGLAARGYRVHAPTLRPSTGAAPLDTLAVRLGAYVAAHVPPGACVALVGHSMGGLVARAYAQRYAPPGRVAALVTAGSPHHGTLTAFARGGPGVRAMRPGSAFLRGLGRDPGGLAGVPFTSLWTPLDGMIVPAGSSRVRGEANVALWLPAHPSMRLHPRAVRRVADVLDAVSARGTG